MTNHISREDRKSFTPDGATSVEVELRYGGSLHNFRILVTCFHPEEPSSWDYPGAPGCLEFAAWRCKRSALEQLADCANGGDFSEADSLSHQCIWCDDLQEEECSGEWVDIEDKKLEELIENALWRMRGSYY